MAHADKVILLEVNELPYRVIDDWSSRHPDSCLSALLASSKQFETVCEDQIELDPWISWPTLHRGVIDEMHRILHLGQPLEDANVKYPPIWQLLAEHGVNVGVMGSLHTGSLPQNTSNYSFYVPDFFADSNQAHPAELRPFQAFNLAMTRRSGRNVDAGLAKQEALAFARKYPLQGLSLSTLASTLRALVAERRHPHLKCRRRSIQPLLTLDVFLHMMRKKRPGFATLHTNHVAAAMHRYWAAAYPTDARENHTSEEWRGKYRREIDFTMSVLDQMLLRLTEFVKRDPAYKLVLASSLGQAAVTSHMTRGFTTVRDVAAFMRALGLSEQDFSQRFAMVPCVSVVTSPEKADEFERKLSAITVSGRKMVASQNEIAPLSFHRNGNGFHVFVYFEGYAGEQSLELGGRSIPFTECGFGVQEHQDEIACSARHTPDGVLLVHDPNVRPSETRRSRISTLHIAPALLAMFGVEPRSYMAALDESIFDVSVPGTRLSLETHSGGVERPVVRGDRARNVAVTLQPM